MRKPLENSHEFLYSSKTALCEFTEPRLLIWHCETPRKVLDLVLPLELIRQGVDRFHADGGYHVFVMCNPRAVINFTLAGSVSS